MQKQNKLNIQFRANNFTVLLQVVTHTTAPTESFMHINRLPHIACRAQPLKHPTSSETTKQNKKKRQRQSAINTRQKKESKKAKQQDSCKCSPKKQ